MIPPKPPGFYHADCVATAWILTIDIVLTLLLCVWLLWS